EKKIEARFAAGTPVPRSGMRLPSLQLVIDGRIETNGHGWGPRREFGALEVFAGREAAAPANEITDTHTLEPPAPDGAELLKHNFGLLPPAPRALASHMVRIKPPATAPPQFSSGQL